MTTTAVPWRQQQPLLLLTGRRADLADVVETLEVDQKNDKVNCSRCDADGEVIRSQMVMRVPRKVQMIVTEGPRTVDVTVLMWRGSVAVTVMVGPRRLLT